MKQQAAFWSGEADAWFERNRDKEPNPLVIAAYWNIDAAPKKVLEIGCGDGRYLSSVQTYFSCECIGVDPSEKALEHGKKAFPALKLYRGTAETAYRMFRGDKFDILIFGFCLYVLDRDDLFSTVAFADALLAEGGHLAIHDFHPTQPELVPYHHKEGLFTYKMRYDNLWLANPAYEWVSEMKTADGEAVTVLRKDNWDKHACGFSFSRLTQN